LIGIIDYGVGNLTSIQNMFKKARVNAEIVNSSDKILDSTKLLLPGMGHFDNCMVKIRASGFLDAINKKVHDEKTPILGICVGLQMFMASSEEGAEPGLGWISGETVRFDRNKMGDDLKVPNMGWLEVRAVKESQIFTGLDDSRFYFAHSFHVQPPEKSDQLLVANYGYEFTVGIEHGNLIGVQFHPEKSHRFGLKLLENFAANY
jgi:imidazole glycerol-phosphate synthase subunit HisH